MPGDNLNDLYETWKKKNKKADIYLSKADLKMSIEGSETTFPFTKDRGPLQTLAYVVALAYETCGAKTIEIHEEEEIQ